MSSKRKSQPTRILDEAMPSFPTPPTFLAKPESHHHLISNLFGHFAPKSDPTKTATNVVVKDDKSEDNSANSASQALELAQFEYLRAMAMNSVAQQQQQQQQQEKQQNENFVTAYKELLALQQLSQRKSMEDMLRKLATDDMNGEGQKRYN